MYQAVPAVLVASVLASGCKQVDDPDPGVAKHPVRGEIAARALQPAAAGAPVEVCSFASRAAVEAALGSVLAKDPEPSGARGSLLGQCTYSLPSGETAMVMARPAHEFEATVRASGEGHAIAGLGERAFGTAKTGAHVKLAGKRYFLVTFVAGANGPDLERAEKLARAVVPGAR